MSSVLLTPVTQENAATLREQLAAEKLASDKANLAAMAKELQLQEDRATQDRLIAKLTAERMPAAVSGGSASTRTPEDSTRRTLLNIVSAVILSIVTLMFLHYYASNPTLVMLSCFLYVVLYCAFIIYVVNKVEESFPDQTLAILAKWTSILALVLCLLLAMSTTKAALLSPPAKANDAAKPIVNSAGNQLYPPGQNNNRMRNRGNRGQQQFNNGQQQNGQQQFNNGPRNNGPRNPQFDN